MLSLQKTKATHPFYSGLEDLTHRFVCFLLFSGVHQVNLGITVESMFGKNSHSKHVGHRQARDRPTAIRDVGSDTVKANLSPWCCDYIWDLSDHPE